MKPHLVLSLALIATASAFALDREPDPAYRKAELDWRANAEKGLRRDNGWLTLAGRYELKFGENLFGTGERNDIVFPKGLGPAGMGSIFVEPGRVRVKLVEGLRMKKEGIEFTERVMSTDLENRDWVSIGRAAFHIIEREGKYILRLADNESEVRKGFGGRVWYDVDDRYRVPAKFVLYDPPRKVSIVDVIDQVSEESVPGYVEFELSGRPYRLDVVGDDKELFLIFKDSTAGDTTYASGRFLYTEKPEPGKTFLLDFNRAYNPPCAFSEFTTCPLPPKQNILKVRIDAGEKYPPLKKTSQWPPPAGVEARMHELQAIIGSRDSTAAQREAAREELGRLLKSPAGQSQRTPEERRPARAAIQPFPSIVKPAEGPIPPAPPVAQLEIIVPPKQIVNSLTGAVPAPSGRTAIDPRTGHVLHETPGGYIDPRTGQFTPK